MFFSYKDIFRENEKIAMRYSIWVPGKLEVHTHDFFEIAYIVKGNGYHFLDTSKHTIRTGDLFLLTPDSKHNFRPDGGSELEWINCMFLPDVIDPGLIGITGTTDLLKSLIFFDSFKYDTTNLSGIELLSSIEDLNKIFKDMIKEYDKRLAGYQDALKNYLQILLIKIFRAYYVQSMQPEGSDQPGLTNLVTAYLNDFSLRHNVNINELARQAFYSPQYFRKRFRNESGVTLASFIRQKRLDAACELLVDTDSSVNCIMEQVGMNDAKSFYAAFSKEKGMTPAQYRAKFRQQ
ncbi:MAG: AraC family transcriptional regulator [Firmicutes bacterium]|nr:AraC family transcriptional regulator [Bacillota bacterium]